MKKVINFLCYPIQKEFSHFCTFLFLILFSNILFFKYSIENLYFKFISDTPILTISLAVCLSYTMVFVLSFIRYIKCTFLSKIFLIANYIFLLSLTLFESVSILIFEKPICADIFETFFTTNSKETIEFINVYIDQLPIPIVVFLAISLTALILRLLIQKILQKHQIPYYVAIILIIMTIPILVNSTDNVILYLRMGVVKKYLKRNCYKSINISRLAGAFHALKELADETHDFELRSRPEKVQYISNSIQCSNIVVIIGESFSKYHSSLYTYSKETNPKLSKLKHHNLYVYNDVISTYDLTTAVLKKIYGINKNNTIPPFPSILRGAGYKTILLDNQQGFMYQKRFQPIWSNMYDTRNSNIFKYDKDLIDMIDFKESNPSLYVIELEGQHYTYAQRYPEDFSHFKPKDYSNVSNEQQAEILAHYDNATLYNDSVIYSIIQKFSDLEVVVIYFSDHGEEIYDWRNFMGHSVLSGESKAIKYLIEIPFMIWFSDTYKQNHPDKAEQIKNAVNRPYITSDLTHLVMDISGVKAKGYDPTRSVINEQFESSRDRIILDYINYDQWKNKH